jgi:two-component system, NarL family, sensor histidine kinase UhpB
MLASQWVMLPNLPRVCHDRRMGVVGVDGARGRRLLPHRTTLFWRLFGAYAGVLGLAVAVLIFAPVRVSVPTALGEAAVLLVGFALALAIYFVLLRRALAPLERLTRLMRRVDPLAPGQRIETRAGDDQVVALTQAFNDMLDRLEDERRESALRALAAQERERRRIARELHDEIGQTLTGLVLRSETIARRGPPALRGDLEELREAVRRGAEDVRSIAQGLRPEALDELGLQSALAALSSSLLQQSGLHVERALEPGLELSAEEELVIYRVAQEALTNVVRHARASQVTLTLRRRADGVVLTVADDGIGLPRSARGDWTGVRGMRERALLIGAELVVRAAAPRGTEVRLRIPRRPER